MWDAVPFFPLVSVINVMPVLPVPHTIRASEMYRGTELCFLDWFTIHSVKSWWLLCVVGLYYSHRNIYYLLLLWSVRKIVSYRWLLVITQSIHNNILFIYLFAWLFQMRFVSRRFSGLRSKGEKPVNCPMEKGRLSFFPCTNISGNGRISHSNYYVTFARFILPGIYRK